MDKPMMQTYFNICDSIRDKIQKIKEIDYETSFEDTIKKEI
ncbi:hypothetical protein ACFO3D_03650 [Virgibacillus kekensis]|uniref:Uncharacterized protein n=1 Tax=Virgibacillus kekensis TaxID=202261 RepID=A0ABV9DG96_9BACI